MITDGIIIALIGALAGIFSSVATNHFMRPKMKADAFQSAAEGFAASSTALMQEIKTLKKENENLREVIQKQQARIFELEQKLNRGGLALK